MVICVTSDTLASVTYWIEDQNGVAQGDTDMRVAHFKEETYESSNDDCDHQLCVECPDVEGGVFYPEEKCYEHYDDCKDCQSPTVNSTGVQGKNSENTIQLQADVTYSNQTAEAVDIDARLGFAMKHIQSHADCEGNSALKGVGADELDVSPSTGDGAVEVFSSFSNTMTVSWGHYQGEQKVPDGSTVTHVILNDVTVTEHNPDPSWSTGWDRVVRGAGADLWTWYFSTQEENSKPTSGAAVLEGEKGVMSWILSQTALLGELVADGIIGPTDPKLNPNKWLHLKWDIHNAPECSATARKCNCLCECEEGGES